MTQERDLDVQAQEILKGLKTLGELLEKPVARDALDLNKNATTSSRYEILRRLRQSLRQYLERGGDLFYVGLLGHFSAGKTSTINSLLSAWESKHERSTGLNPTDTTITLITREVCQFFCVNGEVLFLGMGCRGRGQFPFPGPAI